MPSTCRQLRLHFDPESGRLRLGLARSSRAARAAIRAALAGNDIPLAEAPRHVTPARHARHQSVLELPLDPTTRAMITGWGEDDRRTRLDAAGEEIDAVVAVAHPYGNGPETQRLTTLPGAGGAYPEGLRGSIAVTPAELLQVIAGSGRQEDYWVFDYAETEDPDTGTHTGGQAIYLHGGMGVGDLDAQMSWAAALSVPIALTVGSPPLACWRLARAQRPPTELLSDEAIATLLASDDPWVREQMVLMLGTPQQTPTRHPPRTSR